MTVGGRLRRETFYEAQRRHRRADWVFALLSAVGVSILSVPLSVIVAPFLLIIVLVTVLIVSRTAPTLDLTIIVQVLDRVFNPVTPMDVEQLAVWAGALLIPGVVTTLPAWLLVRRLFLRAGTGAVALAAGARSPNADDLEERQLTNLVEEMAVAAGIPPPQVLVIDAYPANAAVVGRSLHDATVIVPRWLLNELGRAPTGAVVADLLASVINGDLRVAMGICSMVQTLDLVAAVLSAPISRRTRRTIWRLIRLGLRPRSRRGDGREEHYIANELALTAELETDDTDEPSNGLLSVVLLPFTCASFAFMVARMVVGGLFVSPFIGGRWRRRRLLADATAVELTRDPDALARALSHLRRHGAPVPPGPWAHLFLVEPATEHSSAMLPGRDNEASSTLVSFLPPLHRRLDRLAAMGANTSSHAMPWEPNSSILGNALVVVVGILIAVPVTAVMLLVVAMSIALVFAAFYIVLMVVGMILGLLVGLLQIGLFLYESLT